MAKLAAVLNWPSMVRITVFVMDLKVNEIISHQELVMHSNTFV